MRSLTAEELINIFVNRTDVFAQQLSNGMYVPVKRPITIKDVEKHLKGDWTLGLYCLNTDNKVKWTCVDLDTKARVSELRQFNTMADNIYNLFPDFNRIKEFSGRRGYHIWLIFKKPIQAKYAKSLIKARLNKLNLPTMEVYPKQTELIKGVREYGNLVKMPCGIHKLTGKKSTILKMDVK